MVEVYWSMHALLSPPLSLPALVRRNSIHWRRGRAFHPRVRARKVGARSSSCKEGQGGGPGLSHSTVVRACLLVSKEPKNNLEILNPTKSTVRLGLRFLQIIYLPLLIHLSASSALLGDEVVDFHVAVL